MNETYPIQDKPQDLSMKTVRRTKSKYKPPNLDLNARTLPTSSDENGAPSDLRSPKSPADLPRECLPIRKRPFVESHRDLIVAKSPKSAGPNGFAASQSLAFDYRNVNTAPSSPLRLPPPTISSTLSLTPSSASSLASVNSAFTHFPVPPLIPTTSKSPYLLAAAAAASAVAASSGNGYPPTPTDLPSPYTWPSPHPVLFPSHFPSSVLPHSPRTFPTTALLSPAPSSSYQSSANSSREDLPVGTISGGTTITENLESKRRFLSSRSAAADSSSPVPSSPLRSPRTWSHSWPTPAWQCFVQGTMIKFIIPDTETPWQKAEDLGWKDMVSMKVDNTNHFQYAPNGLTIVKIDVISQESSNSRSNGHLATSSSSLSKSSAFTAISTNSSEVLTYLRLRMAPHRGDSSTEILAECSLDHPFYVKEKGWCSIQPRLTIEKYGIPCQEISVGDICLPPNHPEAVRTPDLCDRFRKFEFEDQLSPLLVSAKGVGVKAVALSSSAISSSPSSMSAGAQKGQLMSPPCSPAKKKEKDVDKPKRPMNGFMLFAKKYRLELIQQHPGKDNRAISVLLGEAWKSLPLEEREQYSQRAKVMADEQKKLFPDCWKRKKTLNCSTGLGGGQLGQPSLQSPPPPLSSSSRPAIPSSNFGAFTPLSPPHHLGVAQPQHHVKSTAGASM